MTKPIKVWAVFYRDNPYIKSLSWSRRGCREWMESYTNKWMEDLLKNHSIRKITITEGWSDERSKLEEMKE